MEDSPLAELEKELAEVKKRYIRLEGYFTAVQSLGGVAITTKEQALLDLSAKKITILEEKIIILHQEMENVNFDNVKDKYQGLINFTNTTFEKVQENHEIWMSYIYTVGLDYSAAYESFKSIQDAQSMYEADVATIATSVFSIVGLGGMSWITDSGYLAKKLGDSYAKYENTIQIGEDVLQTSFDKFMGIAATKFPKSVKSKMDTPFAFQNEVLLNAFSSLLPIMKAIIKFQSAFNSRRNDLLKMSMQPGGREGGTDLAKKEYSKYLEDCSMVTKAFKEILKWINTKPDDPMTREVRTDEFKRIFWKEWLPTLETAYTNNGVVLDEVCHSNWWLSSKLLTEIDRLLDLKKLGIGENGLDYWVTDNDVRLLVLWARNYQTTLKF